MIPTYMREIAVLLQPLVDRLREHRRDQHLHGEAEERRDEREEEDLLVREQRPGSRA